MSIAGASIIWRLFHTNTGWAYDIAVYRMGGSIVWHGTDLYSKSTPHPYTYPPFSALVFIPLALLPAAAASIAWTALSLISFIAVVWLSVRTLNLLPPPGKRSVEAVVLIVTMCLATIWLDPIADTLLAGQVNLVVMALVLTDLLLPDGNRWKGLATGIASSFKLLPLFFVVYLLLTRRFASAGRALGAFGATTVIGFLVLPKDSITYWGGTFLDSSRVGDPQNPRSESLLSLLVRWNHSPTGIRPIWLALEVLVAIAILGFAWWAHGRGHEFLAICIVAAGTLYLSPITWRHHWVWMLPIVLWMIAMALRSFRWLWIPLGLIAIDFYLRPYGSIPVNAQLDLHLDLTQLLLSSTHPMSLLLFLVSAVAVLRGRPNLDSSATTRRRHQPRSGVSPTAT